MSEIKQRILLVDDDSAQLDSLRNIFQQNYEIVLASSGKQALQQAEKAPLPDLILLDTVLLDTDGYEVCRQLKENAVTRMIPVILITNSNETNDGSKELAAGAVDYLVRPFTADHVAGVVKVHLRLSATMKDLEKQSLILAENARLNNVLEGLCEYDFKAPLQAFIDIPIQLSRELTMSSFQKEMLNSISLSASNLLEIISRSIDLYKMEKGTYQLSPFPVDLLKILQQIFQEHKRTAEKKEIRFALNINQKAASVEDIFAIPGEKRLFTFMLNDLIKSAIEASPGNNEIRISLNHSSHSTMLIKFPGVFFKKTLDQSNPEHPLSEAEYFTVPGLYLARLLAKTQGGDLAISMSVPEGTTFQVDLPLAENRVEAGSALDKSVADKDVNLSSGKSKAETKILVVDDYAFMRQTIAGILRQSGYQKIFEASDGFEAITFLENNRADLILCDWEMPGKSGMEVFKFISCRNLLKSTPFIMITASSALSELEIALENGIQHYIVKPFSPDILRKKVEAVLAKPIEKEQSI
ncbi:MAG: two-component hybrid sensor and regulator [uncultured bacterium]|nr:MAG: two-component hybrid sensor and regulator [uncultured bacterium]